jgi:branched-chain amino acid aminotransferase
LLAAGQTGVMNGWGVFSTLRVSKGVLFAWERRWARMIKDAKLMRVPMPDDPEAVARDLLKLIEANRAQESTLRLCVIRNRGGMFEGEGIDTDHDVVAFTSDPNRWGEGVHLAVEPDARHSASRFAGAKILSWSHNLTYLEMAKERGFDEVILLNERGEVSECTSANLFIETDEGFLTPPLTSGCLPGVTRELLLGDARPVGIAVTERAIRLDDVFAARAAFVTSTTRNLLPILDVEKRPLRRESRLGQEMARSLEKYFKDYIERRLVLFSGGSRT